MSLEWLKNISSIRIISTGNIFFGEHLAKEGISVILPLSLLSAILMIGAVVTQGMFLTLLALGSGLLILFSLYFFRDPDRAIPEDNHIIVSPADGKIILIQEIEESNFLNSNVQKISIFMSAFNVHVNRVPVEGQVTYFKYQQGKFLPAYKEDASVENEQTTIGIENEYIKVLLKQIAGILARRIVCHLRQGWYVKRGERFGMIKFGSRVDLFLPPTVKLNIKLNEKVKAGESIIGTY